VRLAVLVAGLLVLAGAGLLHALGKLPTAPTIAAQYFGVVGVVWGLNGFIFRNLPLSGWFSLPVFSAAVFGALFLVGYFFQSVAGPFLIDSAGRFIGLVRLVDLIFYAFALMTIGGAAGCAFSRNIIYSAWSLLFAFMAWPASTSSSAPTSGGGAGPDLRRRHPGADPVRHHADQADRRGPQADQRAPGAAGGCGAGRGDGGHARVHGGDGALEAHPEPSYQPVSAALGVAFLTDFLLPFEVASVVLLAALVGAVIIARKEIKETSDTILQ